MDIESLKFFIEILIGGLAIGSVYALIALGFVIIYKATSVVNFAQGELMMMGAYISFALVLQFKIPFIYAFILTLIFSAGLVVIVEMLVIRPMVGEPAFSVVMITIGLAIIFRALAGIIWTHEEWLFPSELANATVSIKGINIALVHLWTILVAMIFLVIFFVFFRFTNLGVGMRATAEDQDTALLMGIDVKKIFALSWAIAAVVASVAGIFFANMHVLHPFMGFVGLRAFPAVILGGLDSINGAIIGGLIIGVIENLSGGYIDPYIQGMKEIIPWIILIIVLMVRPYGLFGTKEVERV